MCTPNLIVTIHQSNCSIHQLLSFFRLDQRAVLIKTDLTISVCAKLPKNQITTKQKGTNSEPEAFWTFEQL